MMLVRCFGFLVALLVCLAATDAASPSFDPQDGQTVVFLGDSITHQALYTQYIEDFFYTRYPDRKIYFHNAGVAGDSASDALVRFDDDVAAHQPDFVTVLLGMNDGRYEDFNPEILEAYQASMRRLLDRIKAIGAEAIVLSPTMFDHAVTERRRSDETWRFRNKQHSADYNALMAFFGGWCLDESRRRDCRFVNLWAPLNAHTAQGRLGDPAFTMIGDAIHPQASGQLVMAFEILSQLGVERRQTSSIVIRRRGKSWAGSKGVADLEVSGDAASLSFTHQAAALPWVIPEKHSTQSLRWKLPSDGRLGYELTKAGHKLSADRIKIAGLPQGDYEVRIDDQVVGIWNHVTLGTKVELQANPLTPQYQQALRVAELNRARNDHAVRPMRDKWSSIKGLRRRYGDSDDKGSHLISQARENIDALQQQCRELDREIRAASQPVRRRWRINRVTPDNP